MTSVCATCAPAGSTCPSPSLYTCDSRHAGAAHEYSAPRLRSTSVACRLCLPQPEAASPDLPHLEDRATQKDDYWPENLPPRLRIFLADLLTSTVGRPIESILQEMHAMFLELLQPLQDSIVRALIQTRP